MKYTVDKNIFKTLNLKQKVSAVWGCLLANVGILR